MDFTIHPFFEPTCGSYSFILVDCVSRTGAIVDPAFGVDAVTGEVDASTADLIVDWVEAHEIVVRWILDTRVHTDRPSASRYVGARMLCAQTCIGAGTPRQAGYDRYVDEGDELSLGRLKGRVLATPGHTPGCVSYLFDGFAFTGDALLKPELGNAGSDFPGGGAAQWYASVQRILALPVDTRLYVCHDDPRSARCGRFVTSVRQERERNVHVAAGAAMCKFPALHEERGASVSR